MRQEVNLSRANWCKAKHIMLWLIREIDGYKAERIKHYFMW